MVSRKIAKNRKIVLHLAGKVYYVHMNEELIKKIRSDLARRGGEARAKALTAKERKTIAIKASKAAAKARTQKAKERKGRNG
jgi:hypothetical protein